MASSKHSAARRGRGKGLGDGLDEAARTSSVSL